MGKALLSIRALLLCGCLSLCAINFAVELSADAWRQDLDFLAEELPKRHKNLFERLPRKDFEAAVKELRERLPRLSEAEVRVAFLRLVASVANGHTWINSLTQSDGQPIQHRLFGEAFYAVAAKSEYAAAIGARLIGIGPVLIADVAERLRPLVLLETPLMANVQLPGWLSNADALRGTGLLAGDHVTLHYERDGRVFTLDVAVIPAEQMKDWVYDASRGNPPTGTAISARLAPSIFSTMRAATCPPPPLPYSRSKW